MAFAGFSDLTKTVRRRLNEQDSLVGKLRCRWNVDCNVSIDSQPTLPMKRRSRPR
jgi:hypothetical protein